jgi:hypothetical protein
LMEIYRRSSINYRWLKMRNFLKRAISKSIDNGPFKVI